MRSSVLWFALSFVAVLGGCGGNDSCKDACDKLTSCGLKSSGLSCDDNCNEADCAVCIDDMSCSEISAGDCASDCPGVSFTAK